MDKPQFVFRNDDFIDLNMQINDETAVNVEISNSKISEEFQECKGMNIMENADLKLGIVTVNMETSDIDINEDMQECKGMNIMENANLKQDIVTVNLETSDSDINEGVQEFNGMNIMENANLKQGIVTVNMETSDSEIKDDMQEFKGMNIVENANLRRALVAALSSGICDDISRFNREQKGLFNVQWSQVDNQACTDGSVECKPDARAAAKESFHPFAEVKVEKSSFPPAKVKIEANSFPSASIKTENDTSDMVTAYSSEAETTLESQVELQPCDDLGQHPGSAPTVIKKEPGGDNAESHCDQTVRNGLRRLEMNNIKMCKLLTVTPVKSVTAPDPYLKKARHTDGSSPYPVTPVKSVTAPDPSLKKARHTDGSSPYPVVAVKSVTATDPSLKRVRLTDESTSKAKVPRGDVQKKATSKMAISQKHCLVCNAPCIITENKKLPRLPFCGKCKRAYSYQRSRRYATNKSICRFRGACRIDYRQQKMCPRCHYAKFLAVMSAAQKVFKEPFQLQISRQYRHQEVLKLKNHDWSIIRDEILLQEALLFQPQVLLKRIDDSTSHTSLHCASKVQRCRTTSAIHQGDIGEADKTAAKDPAVFGEINLETGEEAQREIPSSATPCSLSESVRKTKMPSARGSLIKDMLNQREGIHPVADRLVSRYSGRVIRRINFNSYSYGALHPVAKPRHSATRIRKKTACDSSQVSVFICGHVCGLCNGKNISTWLKDHGYSKTQPLSLALSGEKQKVIKIGQSSNAALILKKLFELNQLLQENDSNIVLEFKNRPLQHEALTGTSMPSANVPVGSPVLLNTPDVMRQESSTHEVSSGISLSKSSTHEVSSDTSLPKSSIHEVSSDTSLPQSSTHEVSSGISLSKSSTQEVSSGISLSKTSTHEVSSGTSLPQSSTHEVSSDTSLPQSSTYEVSSGISLRENSAHEVSSGTSLAESSRHEVPSGTVKAPLSKNLFYKIASDTINISLPKGSAWKFSSDTINITLPKTSPWEISSDMANTSISKNSTKTSLPKSSAHKVSSDTINTSLSKSSTYEIFRGAVKTSLPESSAREISSDMIKTLLSKRLPHRITSDTINTSLSKSSTTEISRGAVKTSLPESSAREISSDMIKTLLSKCLTHTVTSDAINTSLPNSSAFEISRDGVKASLPKSSIREISRNGVTASLPKSSSHEISRNGVTASLPKSSTHEISYDTVNTFLPKNSTQKISSETIKTLPSRRLTHKSSNDTTKALLSKFSNNEVSRSAVKSWLSSSAHESSRDMMKTSLPESSARELLSGMFKPLLPKIPVHAIPGASQAVVCFFLPVSAGLKQLPTLLPKSILMQPQQPAVCTKNRARSLGEPPALPTSSEAASADCGSSQMISVRSSVTSLPSKVKPV